MNELLTALEQGDGYASEGFARPISRDGWKAYLAHTNKCDMRAFSAYLAKAERRKVLGVAPAEATPLIDEQGRPVLSAKDEMRLVTQAFH